MKNTLLIFFGAGLGGVLRYWTSTGLYFFLGRQFPYGTLIVNISGCFLMGLLFVLIVERPFSLSPSLGALLLIGFLGGYTTFSAFSIETINLFESGHWSSAMWNIALSMVLCIFATWEGGIYKKENPHIKHTKIRRI